MNPSVPKPNSAPAPGERAAPLPPSWRRFGWLLLASLIATTAGAAGNRRVLYAYAPTADDPALLRQRQLLDPAKAGMDERDLVLVPVIGKKAAFEAVLVGKDGGAKLTSAEPIGPERLFETIDAMPMRRYEQRSQR